MHFHKMNITFQALIARIPGAREIHTNICTEFNESVVENVGWF